MPKIKIIIGKKYLIKLKHNVFKEEKIIAECISIEFGNILFEKQMDSYDYQFDMNAILSIENYKE